MLTIGSLCSGYGGLDMAIESFFGTRTAWFSEFEAAPSKILAAHWPDVPNLGDMTKIDWSAVPKVDIIAGGTPCQDLSGAGKRKGMTEGTRSNLWVQMREAVATIRPSLVIWENVRGAFSAYASSEVESEPGLLGAHGPDRPALRALGRVLGDLSDLGYDTEWVGVRASDAGAPHGRFRVFVLAYAQSITGCVGDGDDVPARRGTIRREPSARASAAADAAGRGCDGRAQNPQRGAVGRNASAGSGGIVDAAADTEHVIGYGTGRAWHRWAEPANSAPRDTDDAGLEGRTLPSERAHERAIRAHGVVDWGVYEPAIRRWERALARVAPSPTEPTGKGAAHRLSPAFVEWMMGLPAGHVTDIDITRTEQLKALGNGVVPQQAELALSILWARMTEAAPA